MTYADSTLTTFDQMLGTFEHLLGKAAASDKGEALLGARLAEDMFPLATQVRFVTYQVLNTLNRLGGAELPLDEDDPASFAQAAAMLGKVRAAARETDRGSFVAPGTTVEFDLPNGMAFELTAEEYVRDWSVPQFYFHLMAAYAILRAEGVGLGKADYVPYMMRHLKQAAAAA